MKTLKGLILNPYSLIVLTWYPIFKDVISLMDETSIILRIIIALFAATTIFSIFAYHRYKPSKSKPNLLFYDNFDDDIGWESYGMGKVKKSDEKSWRGQYSLKKDTNSDPNGGYKLIGKKLKAPFIFSGWLYRPDIEDGRWADRLAIEDENNNGYGFSVGHGRKITAIERRDKGTAHSEVLNFKRIAPPLSSWYHFMMCFGLNGKLSLSIHDASGIYLVDSIECKDNSYKEFDRIVVHGGYPYYIDDLKIITT